jgi:hypothetical protein
MALKDLIENKATEGLHLVLRQAIEAAGKLGDGKELVMSIKLKMTREGNGDYAIDGASAVAMTQTERHKIELATWNPDQPDLFESEVG